jgi:hypothetical protein
MEDKFLTVALSGTCIDSIANIKKCKLILKNITQTKAVITGIPLFKKFKLDDKFASLSKLTGAKAKAK